jgi:lipid-A-disaccharide synthase-like uncharacterized protein
MSDLLVQGLELIVALVSVLSEHMLARGKLYGWVWSVIASVLTGFFFLLRHDTVLALVEVLNVPFAVYGFHKWKCHVEKATHIDTLMASIAMVVVTIYFFCGSTETNGICQATASAAFLIGGLLIARSKKMGWYLCIVADALLVYVLLESSDYIFICFQVVSISIALNKTFFKSIRKKGIITRLCLLLLLPH